jgi:hypothetical protein
MQHFHHRRNAPSKYDHLRERQRSTSGSTKCKKIDWGSVRSQIKDQNAPNKQIARNKFGINLWKNEPVLAAEEQPRQ